MTISPNDTIQDIIITNGALFNLGFNSILEQVKALDVPKRVPLLRNKKRPQNIECRDTLSTITMRELDILLQIETSEDYVFKLLATMLKIESDDIPHLQFLGAIRYYLKVLDDLSIITKMWKNLEVHDENSIRPNHPDRGLWAIVDDYGDDKHIQTEIVWDERCMEIYLHFEKKHDRYLAQKAILKAQEVKSK